LGLGLLFYINDYKKNQTTPVVSRPGIDFKAEIFISMKRKQTLSEGDSPTTLSIYCFCGADFNG